MNTLTAGSLRLEPQLASHATPMFELLCDPAIYEFGNAPPASESALRRRFELLETRRSADGSQQWLNWVVRLPSGELAGYVQATVHEPARAYVAYELASRFWRRGIATQALQALLRELASTYAVRDAFAVLLTGNFRSAGLLRKLGFVPLDAAALLVFEHDVDETVMHRSLVEGCGA
jgi:ribosomal-protein-alanine N-acetyltransferase